VGEGTEANREGTKREKGEPTGPYLQGTHIGGSRNEVPPQELGDRNKNPKTKGSDTGSTYSRAKFVASINESNFNLENSRCVGGN